MSKQKMIAISSICIAVASACAWGIDCSAGDNANSAYCKYKAQYIDTAKNIRNQKTISNEKRVQKRDAKKQARQDCSQAANASSAYCKYKMQYIHHTKNQVASKKMPRKARVKKDPHVQKKQRAPLVNVDPKDCSVPANASGAYCKYKMQYIHQAKHQVGSKKVPLKVAVKKPSRETVVKKGSQSASLVKAYTASSDTGSIAERISHLENKISAMHNSAGGSGRVSLDSDLSYALLNGHSNTADLTKMVKDANIADNSVVLGGYMQTGYQDTSWENQDSPQVKKDYKGLGFDALKVATIARIGHDLTAVILLKEDFALKNRWNFPKNTIEVTRNVSGPHQVDQAFGVWNISNDYYAFAGRKLLAFGNDADNNFVTRSWRSYLDNPVDSVGIGGSRNNLDVIATLYNTKQEALGSTNLYGSGIENYAINLQYKGLGDGIIFGTAYMNHFWNVKNNQNGYTSKKIGAWNINAEYVDQASTLYLRGDYVLADRKQSPYTKVSNTITFDKKAYFYSAQLGLSRVNDWPVGLGIEYGVRNFGESNRSDDYSQWVASGKYALNDHTNLGLEYAQFKRHGSGADDQKADALTFDIEAWF